MIDYNQLKIASYKYWEIYTHENQCYLGRVFLQLKDDAGIEDFLALDEKMQQEFFEVGNAVKRALKALFHPDKMNYAALSNTSPKIHVHLVPRYATPRTFNGTTFVDKRWGKNYAPYDKAFAVDQEMLFAIRDAIKEKMRDSLDS